jgi:hypothetical protein
LFVFASLFSQTMTPLPMIRKNKYSATVKMA